MERLVWYAARRLAFLVGWALAVTGALLVRDALLRRGALFADVLAAIAASLTVLAFVAILRARPFFARADRTPPPRSDPYRQNAHVHDDDAVESDRARATRQAAGALFALAIAGALAVVAAASR